MPVLKTFIIGGCEMIVSRMGTFELDGETVTGFFVSATIDELRAIPHNPLLSQVELHPLDVIVQNGHIAQHAAAQNTAAKE